MSDSSVLTSTQLAAQQTEIGERLLAIGENTKAEQRFRAALGFTPDDASLHAALSRALHAQEKRAAALDEIEIALQLAPQRAHFHYQKGTILRALSRFAESKQSFHEAIERNPRVAIYHQSLSLLLWQIANDSLAAKAAIFDSKLALKIYDEALQSVRHALELNPDLVEGHRTLGLILSSCGQSDEALACYERALQLNPEDAQTHVHAGSLLQFVDKSRANAHFREALRINPNHKMARRYVASQQRNALFTRPQNAFQNMRLRFWNATFGRLHPPLRAFVALALPVGFIFLQEQCKSFLSKENLQPFFTITGNFLVAYIVVFASYGNWFGRPKDAAPVREKTEAPPM